jgi:hypothetical protein
MAGVTAAQRAISLVPIDETEAVASLQRRLELPSRDVARTWLTFLRALGLVERVSGGEGTDGRFRRARTDPDPESLRAALVESVFGAREVLWAIADAEDGSDRRTADAEPVPFEAAFDRVAAVVPEWERNKNPRTWEDVWRERVDRLLGWLVLAGAVRAVEGGYRLAVPVKAVAADRPGRDPDVDTGRGDGVGGETGPGDGGVADGSDGE